jgi:hypothetical protein
MTPSGTTTSDKVQTCEWISTTLTAKLEEYTDCMKAEKSYCGASPLTQFRDADSQNDPELLADLLLGSTTSSPSYDHSAKIQLPSEWIECSYAWYEKNAPPGQGTDKPQTR